LLLSDVDSAHAPVQLQSRVSIEIKNRLFFS